MDPETRDIVVARRHSPDGQQRHAEWDDVRRCWTYPWNEMEEGDYFIVQVHGSIEAMKVLFRQTAARKDFEVAVLPMVIDGEQCIRATRVINGVTELKKSVGFHAFNVKARREYLTNHGKKNPIKKERQPRGKITVSEPTEPMVGKEIVTEAHQDFAELRRQRILAARREAAGLPPDQPDFMGVQKG